MENAALKKLVLILLAILAGAGTSKASQHPGIPLTVSDLNTLKSNLNIAPWSVGYVALASDSHSQLSYAMQGPTGYVNRNNGGNYDNENQRKNDMTAVYNLARMWYFTGNTNYAQKSHDILIVWAITQTKEGSGTLTLNGANTYSGGTTNAGGVITIGNATALGSGALTMSGGCTLGNNIVVTGKGSAIELGSANNLTLNAAWAIYGFALSYGNTRNEKYLEASVRLAKKFIAQLDDEAVPWNDFHEAPHPERVRDASAGAIAVCGFQELAKHHAADLVIVNAKEALLGRFCSDDYLDFMRPAAECKSEVRVARMATPRGETTI